MSLTDFDTSFTAPFLARLRMGLLNIAAPILAVIFMLFLPDTAWADATCYVARISSTNANYNILDGNGTLKLPSNLRYACYLLAPAYYEDHFASICLYIEPKNIGFPGGDGFHGLSHNDTSKYFLKFKLTGNGARVLNTGTLSTAMVFTYVKENATANVDMPLELTFALSDQTAVSAGVYSAVYNLTTVYDAVRSGFNCAESRFNAKQKRFTTAITITITVAKACIFQNVSNIDFGRIGGIEAMRSPKTARGEIGVRCTVDLPYRVTMDSGLNADGSIRRMKLSKPAATNPNGSDQYLAYSLANCNPSSVQDGSLGSGLGGAIAGKSSVVASGKTASVQQIDKHQVCATLAPITTSPAAGTYSDRVVLNLEF